MSAAIMSLPHSSITNRQVTPLDDYIEFVLTVFLPSIHEKCDEFLNVPLLSIHEYLDEIISTLVTLVQYYLSICKTYRVHRLNPTLRRTIVQTDIYSRVWRETIVPIYQHVKATSDGLERTGWILLYALFAVSRCEQLLSQRECPFLWGISQN